MVDKNQLKNSILELSSVLNKTIKQAEKTVSESLVDKNLTDEERENLKEAYTQTDIYNKIKDAKKVVVETADKFKKTTKTWQ